MLPSAALIPPCAATLGDARSLEAVVGQPEGRPQSRAACAHDNCIILVVDDLVSRGRGRKPARRAAQRHRAACPRLQHTPGAAHGRGVTPAETPLDQSRGDD
eukprot:scaffold18888_cov112-Isochrysis_galbana.AAC.2